MIAYRPDIDIAILSPNFTEWGDYTKEVILKELEYEQKNGNLLSIVSKDGSIINGFLLGYVVRNSLWLAQAWNTAGIEVAKAGIEMAKFWAKERGLTSITAETKRNEMKAMLRYGFIEFAVIVRTEI